jgi:hypothetical protein
LLSRGAIASGLCKDIALDILRGRREGRALAAPVARLQNKKQAAVTTGLAEASRPSLRDGFNAYSALSLETGLSCPHRPQRSSRQQA